MKFDSAFLKSLLTLPTAPYRENLVLARVKEVLVASQVPFFADPLGNLVVGAGSESEYKKKLSLRSPEPLRLFIAHADHPGFHGTRWDRRGNLAVKWFGGSPIRHLKGTKVWIAGSEGYLDQGRLETVKMHRSGMAIETATVSGLKRVGKNDDAQRLFGAFQFRRHVWTQGSVWYTKAADDLVGVFSICSLARRLYAENHDAAKNFLGLITRAEEVGFIGCLAHFNLRWLEGSSRTVLGVSLETSRTLPNAVIGKGPVVRLGDRAGVFDARSLEVLSQLAAARLPRKHQRRVMDGGTCEGTVVTAYGFPCIALSIPLGNYHNQNFQGGPDARGKDGPAPEFVHRQDIEGLLTLCESLMDVGLPWHAPWALRRSSLEKRLAEALPLLQGAFQ